MQFILLTAAVVLNVIGYLILKHTSGQELTFRFIALYTVGLLLFATATFCFTLSLKAIKLSTAYPVFAGGTCVLIVGLSTLLFKERLNSLNYVGFLLTILGIYLLTRT